MSVVSCSHCGTRVLIGPDGHCPACGQDSGLLPGPDAAARIEANRRMSGTRDAPGRGTEVPAPIKQPGIPVGKEEELKQYYFAVFMALLTFSSGAFLAVPARDAEQLLQHGARADAVVTEQRMNPASVDWEGRSVPESYFLRYTFDAGGKPARCATRSGGRRTGRACCSGYLGWCALLLRLITVAAPNLRSESWSWVPPTPTSSPDAAWTQASQTTPATTPLRPRLSRSSRRPAETPGSTP